MWYFFLLLIAAAFVGKYFYARAGRLAGFVMVGAFCVTTVMLSPIFLGLTTGLIVQDVPRQMTGYIVNVQSYDVVAPTLEVTLDKKATAWAHIEEQLATGEDSYAFMRLSSASESVMARLASLQGKKVTLTYQPWVIQPYRQGLTSYEILDVQIAE